MPLSRRTVLASGAGATLATATVAGCGAARGSVLARTARKIQRAGDAKQGLLLQGAVYEGLTAKMALILNSENGMRTIPVGIALFNGQHTVPYGTIFAGAMAATMPIALIVLVFRRAVLSGLTDGAVKG